MITFRTTMGDISIELDFDKAPISSANFLTYAKDNFYNDTVFHRVINGFMVQGGGMTSDMQQKKTNNPIRTSTIEFIRYAPIPKFMVLLETADFIPVGLIPNLSRRTCLGPCSTYSSGKEIIFVSPLKPFVDNQDSTPSPNPPDRTPSSTVMT